MVVLHTMGSSNESNSLCQLRTGYRALGKALKCVLFLLKHWLVLPSLICGGRWESDWQLSRRKPIGGLGMKGERVKWKSSAHVTPSSTSLFNRLTKWMPGNHIYSGPSKRQGFGTVSIEWKFPTLGHGHRYWQLFILILTHRMKLTLEEKALERRWVSQHLSKVRVGETSPPTHPNS